jgi:cytochrome c oxidase cbb3-type subunit III
MQRTARLYHIPGLSESLLMRLTRLLFLVPLAAIASNSSPRDGAAVPQGVSRKAAARARIDAPARNPFEGNKAAVGDGEKLFVAYNCADCHGGGGSGLMAPSLADNRWRYGGTPPEIYRSITEGRPEGMPRWGPLIPIDQVWKLVSYVRSLGTGKDVATMNFTGKKIERTGHD